ncbi:MAG TPA: T9SS type A sorting domain-containing protein [Bacteroidia bacterium]|nr:T9SS type A sorting domain-containing protein [Bacteroidia bacterium]
MKKIGLIFCLILFCQISRAQNIVQAEYFIDTDLGYGLNTVLSLTASPDSTWSFTIPVPGTLSVGYHKMYVRTLDNSGHWSETSIRNFEVLPSNTTDSVVNGEWFIDTDAGYGLNTVFSVVPVGNDITQSITVPPSTIATLSPGYHKLYGRVQDGYGRWSETFQRNLEVVESFSYPDIVKVEYFNSVDQGYDNCSTEILTASADSEWSFTIPPGIVPFGSDTIYLRVKDGQEGRWSQTSRRIINVINSVPNLAVSHFSISPNPSSGMFAIQSKEMELQSVQVFDMMGSLVYNEEGMRTMTYKLDLSALANGFYSVKMETNEGVFQQMLMKE